MDDARQIEFYLQKNNQNLRNNLPTLVEAFTWYFGEKYRPYISTRFQKTIFFYFVGQQTASTYDDACYQYMTKRLQHTKEILKILFEMDPDRIEANMIFPKEEDGQLQLGRITNAIYIEKEKQKEIVLDSVLNYLFGKTELFDFSKMSPLESFPYQKEEIQKEVIEVLYGKGANEIEARKKIQKSLEYIKKIRVREQEISLKEEQEIIPLSHFHQEWQKTKKNRIVGSSIPLDWEKWDPLLQELLPGLYHANGMACTLAKDWHLVFLPLVAANDLSLIHELGHVITTFQDPKTGREIYGLNQYDQEKAQRLEEIVNELTSVEILEKFQALGGKVFDNHLSSPSIYPCFFDTTQRFYETYRKEIAMARLKGDNRILLEKVGFPLFQRYVDTVYEVSSRVEKAIMEQNVEEIEMSKTEKRRINHLVKEMGRREKESISQEMRIASQEEMMRDNSCEVPFPFVKKVKRKNLVRS